MTDIYYSNQALPHFSWDELHRQRGSGIGALVAGASTIAIPLAKEIFATSRRKNLADSC